MTSTQSDIQAEEQQSEEATQQRHRGPQQAASREWPETFKIQLELKFLVQCNLCARPYKLARAASDYTLVN